MKNDKQKYLQAQIEQIVAGKPTSPELDVLAQAVLKIFTVLHTYGMGGELTKGDS